MNLRNPDRVLKTKQILLKPLRLCGFLLNGGWRWRVTSAPSVLDSSCSSNSCFHTPEEENFQILFILFWRTSSLVCFYLRYASHRSNFQVYWIWEVEIEVELSNFSSWSQISQFLFAVALLFLLNLDASSWWDLSLSFGFEVEGTHHHFMVASSSLSFLLLFIPFLLLSGLQL